MHRGVDVALQPTFYINGSLADTNGWNLTTYVQTNAVGSWFGPLPGAFFSHTNDVGAAFYNVMVRAETPGGSVNYTAFARFRMLDSPGFTPGELPLPAKVIDFADVTVLNPPWGEGGSGIDAATATNIAEAAASNATNALEASLLSRLSRSSRASTNYTDSATNALAYAILSGEILPLEAEVAKFATRAGAANGLGGDDNLRTPEDIFAQLDAATETNAAQSAALAAKASTNDVALTPVYGGNGNELSDQWSLEGLPDDVVTVEGPIWVEEEFWTLFFGRSNGKEYFADVFGSSREASFLTLNCVLLDGEPDDPEYSITVTATRLPNPIIGYTLGDQTDKPIASTNALAAVRAVADAATVTNAAQTAALASQASQLSQQSQSISTLSSQVNTIGAHLNAEDARFVSTNYNSETRMAEAYVEVQVSNSWLTVWREMTRWNWFLGIYTNDFAALSAALASKGEREYAFYDGVTGEPAPDGFFWISQPRIAIAAGMSYQSYVDSAGAVWVLESNGMVADLNGTANGYFRISDDEGNSQFEIVKGSSRLVGASAGAITRTEVMGVTHWHTTYAVANAASAPVAMFCRDIGNPEWYAESDTSCPCNVSWTNPDNGVYVCEWWPKSTERTIFVKAEYGQGTESRIVQNAPVEMQHIVIGGVKYALGTATIDNKTVLTLTAQ